MRSNSSESGIYLGLLNSGGALSDLYFIEIILVNAHTGVLDEGIVMRRVSSIPKTNRIYKCDERTSWEKQFLAIVRESLDYQQSLEIICSCGLPINLVMDALRVYTSSESLKQVQQIQQLAKSQIGLLKTFLPHLVMLSAQMAPPADDETAPPIPTGWPAKSFCLLQKHVNDLRAVADYLQVQLSPYSSARRSGRHDETLIQLCLLVQEASGSPHWRDISDLLEAAALASGRDENWDVDRLRKVFQRFAKAWPDAYEQLQESVKLVRASLPSPGSPVKRKSCNRRRAATKRQPDWTGGVLRDPKIQRTLNGAS